MEKQVITTTKQKH
jgi:hypothetical protein